MLLDPISHIHICVTNLHSPVMVMVALADPGMTQDGSE